jgi:hypothetical protein
LFKKYELKRVTNYLKSLLNNLSHNKFDNAKQASENFSKKIQYMRVFLIGEKDCILGGNLNVGDNHNGNFCL